MPLLVLAVSVLMTVTCGLCWYLAIWHGWPKNKEDRAFLFLSILVGPVPLIAMIATWLK